VIRGLLSGNIQDGLHFSGLGLTCHVSGSFLGLYLTHNFGSVLRLELIYLELLSTSNIQQRQLANPFSGF